MEDSSFVSTMVETTYSDIIEDNKWHYKEFISEFDNMLIGKGLKPLANSDADKKINKLLNRDLFIRSLRVVFEILHYSDFPGRKYLKNMFLSIFKKGLS